MQGRFLLLVTTLLAVAPSTVFAGFDFSDNGQSIDITNMPSQSKPVAYTPARAEGEPERLTKASRPESDPTAPALQVYNERYLPDSIKKKYKLNDAWYGIGQTPSQAQPQVQPQSQLQPAIQPQLAPQPIAQPPVAKPSPTPSPLAEKPPEPFIVDDGPALPGQPLSLTEVKPPENAETWRARKGEPVRDIIKRWSQRDGTDLMWATPDDPILDKDVSYVGTLENAVTQLLRTTGKELYTQYRSDGLTPVMMSPASTVTTTAVAATDTKTSATPLGLFKPKPVAPEPETRWFALSGASLLEVLQVWAEDSHTQLIWQASSTYALKDSVSQVGHFEDAVFKALSQYDDDAERPVGQLYADPATGQKVLLIRNDTTS